MKWILGVCAAAVVFGIVATMTIPAQTITPDQATLKLFPAEATGIAVIDVAGLRNSALFAAFKASGQYPKGLGGFIDATGFQPDRDVDQVTVGKIGAKQMVAVIRARYDHFKVEQFIQDHHAPVETYLGRTLYGVDMKKADQADSASVSFIDDLIVAGHTPAVKQVIDRLAAPASSILDNAALLSGIRGIEVGNQIWAVGQFDVAAIPESARIPAPALEMVKGFKGGSYQMRLDSGVHVRAVGNFISDEAARSTADVIRGLMAVAKLQMAQQPDMIGLLDGLRIDYAGNSMTVRFDGDGELLKRLQSKRRGATAE
jgi:hypothetical protein